MKKNVLNLCCAMLCVCFAALAAEARPKYYAEFKKMYPDVEGVSEAKCNVCHMGKKKKNKNDYGKAYGMVLGEENCKDSDKIKDSLKKAEEKDSKVEGKTYGDLLKDNKLPSKSEEE